MKNFYLLTGSVFSFVYIFAGIGITSGKLNFGLEQNSRFAIGGAIFAYGLFRLFMFYRRIRSARDDEGK